MVNSFHISHSDRKSQVVVVSGVASMDAEEEFLLFFDLDATFGSLREDTIIFEYAALYGGNSITKGFIEVSIEMVKNAAIKIVKTAQHGIFHQDAIYFSTNL
ncbi:hypothetical protein ACJX0J_009245, partial [Zea mays]